VTIHRREQMTQAQQPDQQAHQPDQRVRQVPKKHRQKLPIQLKQILQRQKLQKRR